MTRRSCRPALLPALALAGAAGAADLAFDPKLAQSPPALEQLALEVLKKPAGNGNAVLRARFADRRSKTSIVIEGGLGPTALRDDGVTPDTTAGDGVYAAIVNVNLDQLAQERARRQKMAPKGTTLPLFDLRELRGAMRYEPPVTLKPIPGVPDVVDKFWGFPYGVDPARELTVRHLGVVEDPARTYEPCNGNGTPMGAWTFGKLVTEMANQPATGVDPAVLAEHWVQQWQGSRSINGFLTTDRTAGAQRLLDTWPRLPDGRLDLAQAPFRLLAIVNRQDLRGNTLYGGGGAGEARLVFGAVMCTQPPPPAPLMPQVLGFTVIFEYGVPRKGCVAVRDWAQQWHALGAMALGTPAYNAALQAITDQFTLRDADPSKLPNRSAINQVRTNEFSLNDAPVDSFWELRESKLRPAGAGIGLLEHDTTAQTPDISLMGTTRLRDYVNEKQSAILAGTHAVPPQYPAGSPFLGGNAYVGAGVAWQAGGILNLDARHKFSLATCNGCHTKETGTHVVHIAPRAIGAQAVLSDFLTGANMPVNDPVSGVPRTFHDLLDRQMKLDLTANMSCTKKVDVPIDDAFFRPTPPAFVH